MKAKIQYYLQISVACLLILMGCILLVSPIPIGLLFIGIGLSLLIHASELVQHKIYTFREINNKFNKKIIWVEDKLENKISFISRSLRKTKPM